MQQIALVIVTTRSCVLVFIPFPFFLFPEATTTAAPLLICQGGGKTEPHRIEIYLLLFQTHSRHSRQVQMNDDVGVVGLTGMADKEELLSAMGRAGMKLLFSWEHAKMLCSIEGLLVGVRCKRPPEIT